MADIFLANTIGEELLSGHIYDAIVVSRDDSLNKGRLKIKIFYLKKTLFGYNLFNLLED